jgi:hypothetical protein
MSFSSVQVTTWGARALMLIGAVGGVATVAPASGLVWSLPSGTSGWVGRAVSLGDYGTEVFNRVDGYTAFSRLLSAYDPGAPTPSTVWQTSGPYCSFVYGVDSAEYADTHAAVYLSQQFAGDVWRPTVVKHVSSSSSPVWSHTFPGDNYSQVAGVHMSRDGSRVAAWAFDQVLNKTRLQIFGATSTPLYDLQLSSYGEPKTSVLSADGRHLLIVSDLVCIVVDIQTGAVQGQVFAMSTVSTSGFDLSADGGCIARGMQDHRVDLFRFDGTNYVSWFSQDLGIGRTASQLALSPDGTTLAVATMGPASMQLQVQCVDLINSQHPVVTLDDMIGAGVYSVWSTGLRFSDDGRTLAAITSGDQLGLVPEVLAYRRDAAGAWSRILTRDLPGSAMSLDLSATGTRLVVGSKAQHLNVFGGGGEIDLFDLAPAYDLALDGVPHLGGQVTFDFDAHNPGYPCKIFVTRHLGINPVSFTGIGTLYLSRSELRTAATGIAGADGHFHANLTIAPGNLPQLDPQDSTNTQSVQVGRTLYFQGLNVGLRRLSQDWLPVTILP